MKISSLKYLSNFTLKYYTEEIVVDAGAVRVIF